MTEDKKSRRSSGPARPDSEPPPKPEDDAPDTDETMVVRPKPEDTGEIEIQSPHPDEGETMVAGAPPVEGEGETMVAGAPQTPDEGETMVAGAPPVEGEGETMVAGAPPTGEAEQTMVSGAPAAGSAQATRLESKARRKKYGAEANRVIGNYRLIHRLGAGGMGDVYLAEQTKPIRRHVAFKIVKKGMDTHELIKRFESEQQALALMDHENIAKVFDAGATDRGRPFFVMELVDGVPINDYCDQNGIDTEGRLELFVQVCEGVQHAHQKAVIHRDLKPSNVLVTTKDGIPKIIDFGIAKALSEPLTEDMVQTTIGQLVGTPSYMSPEQADMSGKDIDTTTDIYSLGIMLYELLVGVLPQDPDFFRGIGYDELRRRINEEPPSPSARLTALQSRPADDQAQTRTMDIPALTKELRGDLDWIVMKAIEREKARRYTSASDFARDIRRYLNNEEVLARPPSTRYRVEKFVARHKVAVTAGAFVALALVMGVAGTTVGLVRAIRAERVAQEEAATAQQVSDFLVGLFQVADPDEARGKNITVRQILDEGVARVDRDLRDQPVMQARMMNTLGRVYQSMGMLLQAEPLILQSLELRERKLGPMHEETAESVANLGALMIDQSRYAEAESLLALARERQQNMLEAESEPERLAAAATINDLGVALSRRGKNDEAEPLLKQALALREQALGPQSSEGAETLANLSVVYWRQGEYEAAIDYGTRSLEIREAVLPENHADIARSLNNLGLVYQELGQYDEAIPRYERALPIFETFLEEDHHDVLTTINNLAYAYYSKGDYKAAGPLWQRVLTTQEQSLGPDHADVARTLNNLANLKREQGRDREAVPLFERALAIRVETLGTNHSDVGWSMGDLGILHREQGNLAKADSLFRAALEVFEAAEDSYGLAWTYHDIGQLKAKQGDYASADTLFCRAITTFRDHVSDEHPELDEFIANYGSVLRKQRRHAQADALLGSGTLPQGFGVQ